MRRASPLLILLAACSTTDGHFPARARLTLERVGPVYEELFGAAPPRLAIHVVFDEAQPGYEYDAFDQETGEIRMLWPRDDPALGEWTLLHELAHAYQFAFDPVAYDEEPAWIHEGWAEYAVWRFYARRDPAEGQAFLRSQAERFLATTAPWPLPIEDVYAVPWDEAYPACHLTVQWLARERGVAAVASYFAGHGHAPWRATLARTSGVSLERLGREVTALAQALVASD